MSTTYRPRICEVDPAEVRDVFLRRGYRGLERNYGCSNDVVMQLIAKAGGPALLAERAKLQTTGRIAGGVRQVEQIAETPDRTARYAEGFDRAIASHAAFIATANDIQAKE